MGKREKELELTQQLHATQLETRDREIEKLTQENLRLSQRVEAMERQEASVLQAIMEARETAAKTVGDARKRAQEIYADAVDVTTSAREISANARSIISQAEEKAAEIMQEAHNASAHTVAKGNERAAYIQSEAKSMLEDYQSLVGNARSRLHAMMRSNLENIRDFASKLAVLYANGIPEDLEPLLADSVREVELHLQQMGAPPPEPSQPAIGYTDAQKLVKAIHRMQGRDIPDIPDIDTGFAPPPPSPYKAYRPPQREERDEKEEADADEERVWTVDEVIAARKAGFAQTSHGPKAPDRLLDFETDESLAEPHIRFEQRAGDYSNASPANPGAPGRSGPQAHAAPPVDYFDGLNLRNTGHSDIKAAEYESPVLEPKKDDAFDVILMNQASKLENAPKESAFEGLNLRQGGHSDLDIDTGLFEGFGFETQDPPLKRTKERDGLPDDFSIR